MAVDDRMFLGIEATDDPTHWRLPVTAGLCTGFNFLFGGAAMAGAVIALEAATERPLVWATAQYLSFVRPPSVMDLRVTPLVVGNQVTQAHVVGSADGHDIITASAALGSRPVEAAGTWLSPPEVPPPHLCPEAANFRGAPIGIRERLDSRLAEGRPLEELVGTRGSGRTVLWVRILGLDTVTAAALGILGDHVPFGIGQALGVRAGGNSLDNTLRVVRLVPTEWVLIDIAIEAVGNGFGHGRLSMFAEDGTLMATASQSAVLRFWND